MTETLKTTMQYKFFSKYSHTKKLHCIISLSG